MLEWLNAHRLVASAALFAVVFVIKFLPFVEKRILTTPRLRMLGTGVCALLPAAVMLASGADLSAVWETAITSFFAAIGIHTSWKIIKGDPVGLTKELAEKLGGPTLVLLFVLSSSGCGIKPQQVQAVLEGNRDALEIAKPCLVAQHDKDLADCKGNPTCETTVRAFWKPVADALADFHAFWCQVSPSAEGCEQ